MLLFALFACSGSITIEPRQDGCTDVDFNDPDDSVLVVEEGDTSVIVRRTNVYTVTGMLFDPEITADGRVISVREAWVAEEGGAGEDAFCYAPEVEITGAPGTYEVRWYDEADGDVPFDTVDVEI